MFSVDTKRLKKIPINLKFYNTYFNNLRKKIVSDLADGTSKLTIGKPNLKQYYIDYVPIKTQNTFVDQHINTYNKRLVELKKLIKDAEETIINNMNKLI